MAIWNILGFLVYCIAMWYVCRNFVTFFPFWVFVPRKIWQPWPGRLLRFAGLIFFTQL
jgi:hypothetical protein